MGKMSRDKGARIERELVNDLKSHGIDARRVPLSGATEYAKGDVDIRLPDRTMVGEVKGRKQHPKWIFDWLGENDFLTLREDGGRRVHVLSDKAFSELLAKHAWMGRRVYGGGE